jgi:UDP-glucose 4-epimerase
MGQGCQREHRGLSSARERSRGARDRKSVVVNKDHTVLVTGGAGYIGSHVTLALRDAGYAVVVVDDLSHGHRSLVPDNTPFVHADIADQEAMTRVLREYRPAVVMHFAGSIVVPESLTEPLAYYRNNVEGSRRLIESCVAGGVTAFLFSSSAAIYGEASSGLVTEDAPLCPITPYGRTKLITEWMLADVSRTCAMRYAALRYFNVAGADSQGRSGQISNATMHLLKTACEVATGKRDSMTIFGDDYPTPDGTCIRDYIHVSDLAAAHVRAMEKLMAAKENIVLNCGYGHGFSVRNVIDMVREISGKPVPAVVGPRRAGDLPAMVADATRIKAELTWRPGFDDLRAIVASALAWEAR